MANGISGGAINRRLFVAGAAVAMVPAAVQAAQCPADKKGLNTRTTGPSAPVGVTDNVIATINLAEEKVALPEHTMRMRRLEIKPGGIVPWHSHADRPAMIYMLEGEMTEYTSTCNVPVVLSAGEVVAETHVVSHWWQNHGKKTAVVLSFDILHNPGDAHMM